MVVCGYNENTSNTTLIRRINYELICITQEE